MKPQALHEIYSRTKNYMEYSQLDIRIRWKLFDGNPENFNIAHECVDRHLDEVTALRIGFSDGHTETYTFRQLSNATSQFANMLENYRLEKGDHVFIVAEHCLEYAISFYGCLKRGVVTAVASPRLGDEGLRYRISQVNPKLIIAPSSREILAHEFSSKFISLEQIPDLIKDEPRNYNHTTMAQDPAVIQFSSGTTGLPKPRIYNHGALSVRVFTELFFSLKPTSNGQYPRIFGVAAPGWGQAVWGILTSPMALGYAAGLYSGKFDPISLLEILEELRINVLYVPPTVIRKLLDCGKLHEYELSLERIHWVAEHLDPETYLRAKREFGVELYGRYGSMETGGVLQDPVIQGYQPRPGSTGKPIPGNQLAIFDDNGNQLPPGKIGRLGIFRGGRWIITNDYLKMDRDGYFWWISRADDIIISAGYTIGPDEVESVLNMHPSVAESGVIGVPDRERGQIVCGCIVLKPGFDPSDELMKDLQEFVKSKLGPHAYPRRIVFLEELPKTLDGKIKRGELRRKILQENYH